jgi:hypothetical protein
VFRSLVHGSVRAGDVAMTVAVGAAAQSRSEVGEERVEGDVGEEHWPWDLDPVIGIGYRFVGLTTCLGRWMDRGRSRLKEKAARRAGESDPFALDRMAPGQSRVLKIWVVDRESCGRD